MPEVKVYTTGWSADCHQAKRFLDDEGIFYDEVDIEESVEGARFVERATWFPSTLARFLEVPAR